MTEIIEITEKNFKKEVINSEIPVLVDFWAPWCQPCLRMADELEDLSKELKGKIKIAKVDTTIPENQVLSILYQIQSIPNLKLFQNGKVIKELIGFREKDALKKEIEEEINLS
jgi:thioredoxin 1